MRYSVSLLEPRAYKGFEVRVVASLVGAMKVGDVPDGQEKGLQNDILIEIHFNRSSSLPVC